MSKEAGMKLRKLIRSELLDTARVVAMVWAVVVVVQLLRLVFRFGEVDRTPVYIGWGLIATAVVMTLFPLLLGYWAGLADRRED
jgi:hypothetical protein